MRAAGQREPREGPVDGQCLVVAALPVAGEALGRTADRLVERLRLVHLLGHAKSDAAQQHEPRVRRGDLRRQELVRRDEARHALPQPYLEHAGTLDQIAHEPRVARRPGMAPRRNELPAAGQRPGDAGVQGPLASRIFDCQQVGAVVPDQGMHAPHGAVPADRGQQAFQRRQRGEPRAHVARIEDLVYQVRIDPVEDRQLADERAVRSGQATQQPEPDEIRGETRRLRPELPHLGLLPVPIDRQRDRPAGSLFLDRVELTSGQLPAGEESGDLRSRKAQLAGADDDARTVEDLHGQVQARVRTERECEVQIAGTVLHQPLQQLQGLARQSVHLVEHEQARRSVPTDSACQRPDLVGRG